MYIYISRYGCFVGHTCNANEHEVEDLQSRYAEFIYILHEHVHGMEDPEHEHNGQKNK